MSDSLDHRSHAYRPDLADIRLKGQVTADRFIEGAPGEVAIPVADIRPRPEADCSIDTQALLGEALIVFDISAGWAWV